MDGWESFFVFLSFFFFNKIGISSRCEGDNEMLYANKPHFRLRRFSSPEFDPGAARSAEQRLAH